MKPTLLIILLLNTYVHSKETPTDLQRLRDLRSKQVEQINAQYTKALEKLKTKFTKKSDLKNALIIDKELKAYEVASDDEPNGIVGDWVFTFKGKDKKFNFKSDKSVRGKTIKGEDCNYTWQIKGDTVELYLKNGNKSFNKVKILSDDKLLFIGKNGTMEGRRK